jgi:hypothetical protein
VVRAARYLGVTPWDLYEQPLSWTLRALHAEYAEQSAGEQQSKAAERAANRG